MKLKKLPPQCIAPFRLKEITLHGIGSYYKPARLEIKPLTILCGTNGSGKSTWIKVLSTLKEALEPLRNEDGRVEKAHFLERLNHVAIKNNLINTRLNDMRTPTGDADGWDTYCGPIGSFSVVFACVKAITLRGSRPEREVAEASSLLHVRELKRNDIVRLRFTQSRIGEPMSFKCFMSARLSVNGSFVEIRGCQPKEAKNLSVVMSAGTEPVEVVTDLNALDLLTQPIKQSAENNKTLVTLIEDLVQHCLAGYFKISAIREIAEYHGKGTEDAERYKETAARIGSSRYVGEHGTYAHFFRRFFSVTPVFDPRKHYSYCATRTLEVKRYLTTTFDALKEVARRLLSGEELTETNASGLKYMIWENLILCAVFRQGIFWQYLCDEHGDMLKSFQERLALLPAEDKADPDMETALAAIISIIDKGIGCSFWIEEPHYGTSFRLLLAMEDLYKTLCEELLLKNDFFRWYILMLDSGKLKEDHFDHIVALSVPAWVRFLASLPETELGPVEVETLNEWALDQCINIGTISCHNDSQCIGLRCDMMFNGWSYELLQVESKAADWQRSLRFFLDSRQRPVGYLSVFDSPEDDEAELLEKPYSSRLLGDDDPEAGQGPCFAPGYFSAGLHQVAPILVQMNMMRMNEVLAVENPEVHLHPGLQLKFMEFFIENALIGKFSLLETHSDLMIRRVMRAITEEKLPQSWVNITFVDTEPVDGRQYIWTSKVEPLQMDERGVVSNWPEGFLDDDEKETKALMRALYGDRFAREDEAADHE